MIGYLEGTRQQTLPDSILLMTAGGVGYQLFVPAPLMAEAPAAGTRERFYVTTLVRDSEIALYGFVTLPGKTLFETLLKVTGVGPKVALALLSAFQPAELVDAVVQENTALLATIPGIGKKTAARLCMELQDRLAKWESHPSVAGRAAPQNDLLSALTNLGFPEKEVVAVLRRSPPEAESFSEQLKQALALLSRR
jgi:Holliday junction DNA helicase RuvA